MSDDAQQDVSIGELTEAEVQEKCPSCKTAGLLRVNIDDVSETHPMYYPTKLMAAHLETKHCTCNTEPESRPFSTEAQARDRERRHPKASGGRR